MFACCEAGRTGGPGQGSPRTGQRSGGGPGPRGPECPSAAAPASPPPEAESQPRGSPRGTSGLRAPGGTRELSSRADWASGQQKGGGARVG